MLRCNFSAPNPQFLILNHLFFGILTMKIAHFLMPSFVVASTAVGAAIATVNRFAPDVQSPPITSVSPIPSTSTITSSTLTPTASTPDHPVSPAPELAQSDPMPFEPLNSRSIVTVDGIGAVRVGMTIAEAEQAAGVPITSGDDSDNGCTFAQLQGIENLLFMVRDNRISRVDVTRDSTIKTSNGAGIGNTEAEIESMYPGQVEVSPHEYLPGAHYLTVVPLDAAERNYRLVFETDVNGVVTRFRSGKLPEVTWVEGCF